MKKLKLSIYLLMISALSACVKDKPQELISGNVSINADSKVLIVNEGNYGWGEGSISIYDASSGAIVENYYKQQNSNASLGNVCQSIKKYNNHYYLVINNSNKIVVTDADNFVKTATISGFKSPRYFLPIAYNKAYVSDLNANTLQIVDLNTNTIFGFIPCMKGTEEMEVIYNKAFITNTNSNYCYVVNTNSDAITDSILIGKGSSSIVIDKNAKVWILARGSGTSNEFGKLVRINPLTLQIEQSLSFNSDDSPHHLRINKTRDTLYYLNKGVHQCLISCLSLPTTPIISQNSKIFYGLGVNPKDYNIYVSDAIDYTQKSKIEIYKPNGNLVTKFNAGVISNGFCFE